MKMLVRADVCKLRKKIEQATGVRNLHYIETVWGRGYMLKDPEAPLQTAPTASALTAMPLTLAAEAAVA